MLKGKQSLKATQPLSTTLAHVLDKSALYGKGISHAMIETHSENRG
jgi:hypothetical protein